MLKLILNEPAVICDLCKKTIATASNFTGVESKFKRLGKDDLCTKCYFIVHDKMMDVVREYKTKGLTEGDALKAFQLWLESEKKTNDSK